MNNREQRSTKADSEGVPESAVGLARLGVSVCKGPSTPLPSTCARVRTNKLDTLK
jgi:hypothetical protein